MEKETFAIQLGQISFQYSNFRIIFQLAIGQKTSEVNSWQHIFSLIDETKLCSLPKHECVTTGMPYMQVS